MGSIYTASQPDIVTGTSLKTLLEIATPSTMRATLIQWWVEFEGLVVTDSPIKVELVRASAGITGATITAVKYDDFAPAANVTVKHTATAEGTPTDVLEPHNVHPQAGILIQYPLGREPKIPVSGFMRLRVTAAVSVQAVAGMVWEE